jgi:hypothetical protein
MQKTKAPQRIQKKNPDLDVLVTKEQVVQIQRLMAQVNVAVSQQKLYVQAILDSVGIDGNTTVDWPPIEKGNKLFLKVTKITNPKKNGEV